MLLGQSIFQSVLTRLGAERGEDEADEHGATFRIHGLGSGFVAASAEDPAVALGGAEAYLAFLAEKPVASPAPAPAEKPPPVPVIPPHLLRLTREEIAEDLGLTPADTEADLAEKRRQFAKRNHPDSVAPPFRDKANLRMQVANLLIDTAIKQIAR